eukprot:CAMPEP_0205823082 /NCGR_PEP_ID=MMETSP0206-20130828/14991_1 /ASSEMBLY_ACC=CAM_ASM_000279 /TAXON_ID=36767 /ORGANISM="Euplotes focardii, Strain TN1" /LENGTH=237 /DNA_ID=CAMNT_0053119927 /DNA_START=29 /DNA_END=742 /DNA_ORIENTATION=-
MNQFFRRATSSLIRTPARSLRVRPPVAFQSRGFARSVIITTTGPDRQGIVADVTDALDNHGASVQESRMALLGSNFALIMRAIVNDTVCTEDLKSTVEQKFPGFTVGLADTETQVAGFKGTRAILELNMEGPDQPGLLKNLTRILAAQNISVRDLHTNTHSAPFAGYSVFTTRTILAFPPEVNLEEFEEDLEEFESKYGVHLSLTDPAEEEEGQEDEEQPVTGPTLQRDMIGMHQRE